MSVVIIWKGKYQPYFKGMFPEAGQISDKKMLKRRIIFNAIFIWICNKNKEVTQHYKINIGNVILCVGTANIQFVLFNLSFICYVRSLTVEWIIRGVKIRSYFRVWYEPRHTPARFGGLWLESPCMKESLFLWYMLFLCFVRLKFKP